MAVVVRLLDALDWAVIASVTAVRYIRGCACLFRELLSYMSVIFEILHMHKYNLHASSGVETFIKTKQHYFAMLPVSKTSRLVLSRPLVLKTSRLHYQG